MDVKQEPKYDAVVKITVRELLEVIGDAPDDEEITVTGGVLIVRATEQEIPDDEPVFILRAKDPYAVPTLNAYLDAAHRDYTGDRVHKMVVLRRLEQFAEFRRANPKRMKQPDTDPTVLEAMTDEQT